MLRKIVDQITSAISTSAETVDNEQDREDAIRLATAVLLIDVARADHVFDESEFDGVLRLVESHFDLQPEDAAELVNEASEEAENLISAYDFTSVLHRHLDDDEKERIVGMLWQVAYADGALDKYEDSLILKISDLMHVSRTRVMRLKHDAQTASSQ